MCTLFNSILEVARFAKHLHLRSLTKPVSYIAPFARKAVEHHASSKPSGPQFRESKNQSFVHSYQCVSATSFTFFNAMYLAGRCTIVHTISLKLLVKHTTITTLPGNGSNTFTPSAYIATSIHRKPVSRLTSSWCEYETTTGNRKPSENCGAKWHKRRMRWETHHETRGFYRGLCIRDMQLGCRMHFSQAP